jgi:hypothetical protein
MQALHAIVYRVLFFGPEFWRQLGVVFGIALFESADACSLIGGQQQILGALTWTNNGSSKQG